MRYPFISASVAHTRPHLGRSSSLEHPLLRTKTAPRPVDYTISVNPIRTSFCCPGIEATFFRGGPIWGGICRCSTKVPQKWEAGELGRGGTGRGDVAQTREVAMLASARRYYLRFITCHAGERHPAAQGGI
ncbi:hypothetical protein E2C01_012035 [Portunus trituberculatus]|uniref:Uncharacterized protein n=1 Tax=Portunus trituberculatus TaxID=210409 RepID=A0A5B7DD34_PORTR|nr:hypothetical protein [Portunus trituberculatus]